MARRDALIKEARASFMDEVKRRAKSLNISLEELAGARKAVGTGRPKKAASGRKTMAVKYRNPETGDTWTGVGRPAKWIAEMETQGRKREEFAV